jgi:hypothetical protein
MKKLSFLLIITLLLLSELSYSQGVSKGDEKSKELTKYIVKPKFPVNVAFGFKKSVKTKVTQVFSDSSTRSFERTLDVFFTYYSPGKPENGITLLRVAVDSLTWGFKTGSDSVYYDSQKDDMIPPLKYEDYEASSVILGRAFNFYYSPYWDFGKIDGDRLLADRMLINSENDGIKDSIRNYFWNYRLSDLNLANLTDVIKNLVPSVAVDTSMVLKRQFKYDTEETTFIDTSAQLKLIKASPQSNVLKVVLNDLKVARNYARIFGFGVFVNIQKSKGKGEYSLEISPQGRIDGANGKFSFELDIQDRNETMKEYIEETVSYQLLGNYKI